MRLTDTELIFHSFVVEQTAVKFTLLVEEDGHLKKMEESRKPLA